MVKYNELKMFRSDIYDLSVNYVKKVLLFHTIHQHIKYAIHHHQHEIQLSQIDSLTRNLPLSGMSEKLCHQIHNYN